MVKNVKFAELNIRYRDCFLEYTKFKDNSIKYKYLCCKKSYQQKFDENLKQRFLNPHKFSNYDKFILLLRKVVCPYKYSDDWEKLN